MVRFVSVRFRSRMVSFLFCGDRCMRRWVVSADRHAWQSMGREFMVSAFWGGGSNARPCMVWARGMRGERVYGVSLFPLDKQNVTIDGLLNLRWTNRSIRDPFSRYALTFFEHMYTYETIHGHVGYSCLLLDILNLPSALRRIAFLRNSNKEKMIS